MPFDTNLDLLLNVETNNVILDSAVVNKKLFNCEDYERSK